VLDLCWEFCSEVKEVSGDSKIRGIVLLLCKLKDKLNGSAVKDFAALPFFRQI